MVPSKSKFPISLPLVNWVIYSMAPQSLTHLSLINSLTSTFYAVWKYNYWQPNVIWVVFSPLIWSSATEFQSSFPQFDRNRLVFLVKLPQRLIKSISSILVRIWSVQIDFSAGVCVTSTVLTFFFFSYTYFHFLLLGNISKNSWFWLMDRTKELKTNFSAPVSGNSRTSLEVSNQLVR